jgi:hypothetical protein
MRAVDIIEKGKRLGFVSNQGGLQDVGIVINLLFNDWFCHRIQERIKGSIW